MARQVLANAQIGKVKYWEPSYRFPGVTVHVRRTLMPSQSRAAASIAAHSFRIPCGIPSCSAGPMFSAHVAICSPHKLARWVIRTRPSISSNVQSNLATTPGAGNSKTAFVCCTSSTICHSIFPALLLYVTPRVPTANSSCDGKGSGQ